MGSGRTGGLARGHAPGHCGNRVERHFRDAHTETWWALEVVAGPYGPTKSRRAVVATTDPATLPELSTWYLRTNLPAAAVPDAGEQALPVADLAEIVRLYGLRNWVEHSYKQVKHRLGWSQYQVRSDLAIRRHWALVCCAFSACWMLAEEEITRGQLAPADGHTDNDAPEHAGGPAAGRGKKPAHRAPGHRHSGRCAPG